MAVPVLSGLADALSWYQEHVPDQLLGTALNNPLGRGLMRGNPLFGAAVPGEEAFQGVRPGMAPDQVLDQGFQDAPFQRFLLSSLADPLNAVGFGLPGKAATVAPKALRPALEALNVVDQAPGRLADKAGAVIGPKMKAGFDAGYEALAKPIGDFAAQHPKIGELGEKLAQGMQLWRDQALLSIPFHLNNFTGNLDAAARAGRWDVVGDILKGVLKGRDQEVDDVLTKLANNRAPTGLPADPTFVPDPESFGYQWNEQLQKLDRAPNIHSPVNDHSPFRDLPDSPLNFLRDRYADLSEASRHFGAEHIEGPGRDSAFKDVFLPAIKQKSEELVASLRSVGNPRADFIADEIEARQGLISPDALADLMFPGAAARRAAGAGGEAGARSLGAGGARVPDWRDFHLQQWKDGIIDALKQGNKPQLDLFYDYGGQNPIDQLGRGLFAFHRYAVNTLPTLLKQSLEHPGLPNVYENYFDTSDQYNAQHGLSSSFHGEYPIGEVAGQKVFVNPAKMLPMGSLMGAITQKDFDRGETPLGDVAQAGRDLGLGLNPFIDMALHATGQYGRDMPPGLLRAAQPINAAAGLLMGRPVDIEGPLKQAEGGLAQMVSGNSTFPYQDYLVRKRAAETNHGDPVASLLPTSDPRMQAAQRDVANELGAQGLLGFLGVPGLKFLSPEEAIVGENAHLAKQQDLQRFNPTRDVYKYADPLSFAVANYGQLSPAEQAVLLRDPAALRVMARNYAHLTPKQMQAVLANPSARAIVAELESQRQHPDTHQANPWLR